MAAVDARGGTVLRRRAAAIEPRHFERDGDLGAELLRLGEGAAGQRLAGNAGGKAEIVLDARRGAGLAADGALIEHDHRQAFRGGIDRGGKAGGTGADHRDVIDGLGVELRRDAETHRRLRRRSAASATSRWGRSSAAVRRPARRNARPPRAPPRRRRRRAPCRDSRCATGSLRSRTRSGEPGRPISSEPTPPSWISATRRRMKARMTISPSSAEPITSARICAASNGSAVQPSGPGLRRRQRAAAGKLADLAGKLALGEQDDRGLPMQAVAAHDLDPAVEHQPGRRVAHADIVDELARGETPGRAAGKAPGGLDLRRRRAPETSGRSGCRQDSSRSPAEAAVGVRR